MSVLEITSREFRDKPLNDDSMELSPAMEEKIAQGIENIREGKTKRYSLEELRLKMGI